MMVALDSELVL